ncbi:uncharacterized protein LOC107981991 [Nasonia vitripennis]|uniref:Uncharacterized protein n=1 Tax=Nasonia vitripennis TaxID=7425 RepID=A0A7M7PYR4_NASVI|nr:uncharacterized protein LOC107981991 [Nasonia vitripennis]XP_031778756.1 uncharacterized protein LOC107981991 [Nasonia vitripennis]
MENQGYVPFEVVIQASIVVRYLRTHVPAIAAPAELELTVVTFETIDQKEGTISIEGYVKTKFTSVASRFENSSYGCGSITDGVRKITINIRNFVPAELEKGDVVTVLGLLIQTMFH